MAIGNTKSKINTQADAQYGIELTEVDFKEFDRRKAPRLSNYDTFLKSLEPASFDIEFIV